MEIKKIFELISEDMEDVNIMINRKLDSNIILINDIIQHIMSGGGKRIRPVVTILTARALSYVGNKHIIIAALIECIHTATLLHDDVVDKSKMRRGKISSNVLFGNAESVLVGDFIYTRVLQMLSTLESIPILRIISEAVNIIAEGEILQLSNCNNPNLDKNFYLKMISCKTAQLFAVAAQTAALISGASIEQERALCSYGHYLGIVFQLIDDVLDYSSNINTLGKNIGDDLDEGKLTFPLLHVIQNGTLEESSMIRNIIINGKGRSLLEKILIIMDKYDSLNYTRKYAEIEANKAVSCLSSLPYSKYRVALEELVSFIVYRKY